MYWKSPATALVSPGIPTSPAAMAWLRLVPTAAARLRTSVLRLELPVSRSPTCVFRSFRVLETLVLPPAHCCSAE
jgi:hypothetical protein